MPWKLLLNYFWTDTPGEEDASVVQNGTSMGFLFFYYTVVDE